MIRWPEVAPDGGRVVFQALGRIWIKDLPDGTPRRLVAGDRQDGPVRALPRLLAATAARSSTPPGTTGSSAPSAPSTSTPGRVPHGRRRPRPLRGAGVHPGRRRVVYRKVAGGYSGATSGPRRRGSTSSALRGGGRARAGHRGRARAPLRRRARSPLPRAPRGEDGRTLVSIGLDGTDEREHLTSENAGRFRVSPTAAGSPGRSASTPTSRPSCRPARRSTIRPSTKAMPVATVSRDAGDFLTGARTRSASTGASGRSCSTGTWPMRSPSSQDPTREEARAARAADAREKGVAMGLEARRDRPSGTVAFVGGRIVTMRGDEVIEDGTLVVDRRPHPRRRRARSEVDVPAGARVIDTTGKTLIPGLVDVHWHGGHGSDGIIPQQNWDYFATLAFGVTTIHDPSDDTATVFSSSEMARAGRDHRAARLLHRHHPLRRRDPVPGGDRQPGRRPLPPAADEGGGRDQRQELQPAAPRPAPAGAPGRPRAGDDGGAGGRVALRAQHDHGGRRPHRRRALDPGGGDLRRRAPALGRQPTTSATRRP